jgi:hypothetical protein
LFKEVMHDTSGWRCSLVALSVLLVLLSDSALASGPADCEAFAKTHAGFAELIGAKVEIEDIYGSLFQVSVCTDSFDACGQCNGGGNAGYCELWLGKRKRGLEDGASEANATEGRKRSREEKEGNCIGKFSSATAITVGTGT